MDAHDWQPTANGVITEDYSKSLSMLKAGSYAMDSEDVILREFCAAGHSAAAFYIDGLTNSESVQRFLIEPLITSSPPSDETPLDTYFSKAVLPLASISFTAHLSEALSRLFSGDAVLIVDTMPGALIADVKGFAHRNVAQPINESVVAGPHEGFTESLRDNTALIRRLLRSPALISSTMTIGNKIPVRLCMLYLDGIAKGENVEELKRRISSCPVDYVSSIGMLEQLLEDHPLFLFPQAAVTERPDRAVSFLNEGQIVVLMENAPSALVMPVGFLHLFHAPDDTAMRWQYGTFFRLLRLAGLLIALLLPALFVSLTVYHPEGMSLSLLTSVIESQAKVPLSLFSSTLIMLLIFSLINEAALRVPGAMGASLSIVGGLILGQAVVEAELFSPLVLIVVALSGLGSYTAPCFSLTVSIRIAQLLLVLAAGLGGYLGLSLMLFCLLLQCCGASSMGQPFFSPAAPKRPANPDGAVRLPVWRQRLRGAIANPFYMNRVLGRMRAWDSAGEKK